MRQGLPYYRRYPLAFLDGAQGLGPDLIGAYAILLDLIYARNGRTVRDDRHLAGILGCHVLTAKSLTNKLIAAGKIDIDADGRLFNRRADEELAVKQDISSKRSRAGSSNRRGKGTFNKNSVRKKLGIVP